MKLERLFERVTIGSTGLQNRLVMPAMGNGFNNEDGTVSDRAINYYCRRAEGGVGLVISELISIDPLGDSAPNCLRIYDEKYLQRLSRLAAEVKKHGARIAAQLNHAGRQAPPQLIRGKPVSSSPIPAPSREVPRELTKVEIKRLVGAFIKGAEKARQAGFDGVELHCAHGYLIWQFLSSLCNRRADEYGEKLSDRCRFVEEIIIGIRERFSGGFPVIVRISGSDFVEGGLSIQESCIIAKRLESAGANAIHVSGGSWNSPHWMIQPMLMPRGCLVELAKAIKGEVSVPVIAVGRINDPELAESIVQEGKADLIAMGRGLLADPDMPEKARTGRLEDIRKCIACNFCIGERVRGRSLACAVNPELGRESESRAGFIPKARDRRKIVVVGAGPAGLEAARVASLRGHDVTLLEAKEKIGGQLNLAAKASYKHELRNLALYYETQLRKCGVKVKLETIASASLIQQSTPDAVVIATGAVPLSPTISGADQGNVYGAWDILEERAQPSGKVLVVGGGSVGCETADFIRSKGNEVIILEALDDIANDAEPFVKAPLKEKLVRDGIKVITGARVKGIDGSRINYENKEEADQWIEADSVVIALGSKSAKDLFESLGATGLNYEAIGDCVTPRRIHNAIAEGSELGRKI